MHFNVKSTVSVKIIAKYFIFIYSIRTFVPLSCKYDWILFSIDRADSKPCNLSNGCSGIFHVLLLTSALSTDKENQVLAARYTVPGSINESKIH